MQTERGAELHTQVLAALDGVRVGRVDTREPTLEDAYIAIVEEADAEADAEEDADAGGDSGARTAEDPGPGADPGADADADAGADAGAGRADGIEAAA